MSSKTESKIFGSLIYPLNLWLLLSFGIAASLIFWIFDRQLTHFVQAQTDRELLSMAGELKGHRAAQLDLDLIRSEIDHHSKAKGVANVFYRVQTEQGWLHSDLSDWQNTAIPDPDLSDEASRFFDIKSTHGGAKVLEMRLSSGNLLQIGLSLGQFRTFQTKARTLLGISMFALAILGTLVVTLILRRSMRRLQQVFIDASYITQTGDFNTAIPTPSGHPASDWLAETFNHVFASIDKLMVDMDQVLGDVAHDLRTPVARLRSHAESLISESDAGPREIELAGRTIEECDHLLGVVNTILEINAAEARTTALRHQKVDMVSLIQEAVDLFDAMIEDKHHEVSCQLPKTCLLWGDRSYLQRILANLLDNAIKYTPQGGQIRLVLQSHKGILQLEIRDNGIGVSETESALIFNRFYRSDKSRTMPGNGLGLTFCKAIIDAMGGELFHQPNPGGGSIFTITLPDGGIGRQPGSSSQSRRMSLSRSGS